jgi:DNA-directed RNA polymerase subunit RPC12/RpoP
MDNYLCITCGTQFAQTGALTLEMSQLLEFSDEVEQLN